MANETTIGYKRILRLPNTTTTQVRIQIKDAKACPVISEVQLYKAPDLLATPEISRNREGPVTIQCASPDPELHYTLDGSEPAFTSPGIHSSLALPRGGVIKVIASSTRADCRTGSSIRPDIAPANWKVIYADDKQEQADRAIDENPVAAGLPVLSKASTPTNCR